MQANISGKCICCLAEGKHQNGDVCINTLKLCLGLVVIPESQEVALMCSACISFVNDMQRFRDMVLATQSKLLQALNVKGNYTLQGPTSSSAEEIPKVEHKDESGSKSDVSPIVDHHVNWEPSENEIDVKRASEEKKITCKRKITSKVDNKESTRKRKKYNTEKVRPTTKHMELKKIKKEPKSREISAPIRHNRNIRSNIILILKHSTIIPFVNDFKYSTLYYKCFYCGNTYITFNELRHHMNSEHVDACETTIRKYLRSTHKLDVTADISNIKCKLCDEEFKSVDNLPEHLSKVHKMVYHDLGKNSHGIIGFDLSKDVLKCHLCDKKFQYFYSMVAHMNEHYGSYPCYICGKKFMSEKRCQKHTSGHGKKVINKCKNCGEIFRNSYSLSRHVHEQHLKSMLACPKCPETFSYRQRREREQHMAETHGLNTLIFKCDVCKKEFQTSHSLGSHKRKVHNRKKELRCEICSYITSDSYTMKQHLISHSGVKNYECEFCKKKLATSSTLKKHVMIHLNVKRFACSLCDAAFIQKHCLVGHFKSKHPDSEVTPPLKTCGKKGTKCT